MITSPRKPGLKRKKTKGSNADEILASRLASNTNPRNGLTVKKYLGTSGDSALAVVVVFTWLINQLA